MLDNLRGILEEQEELPHKTILTYDVWYWAADMEDSNDRWFGG